MRVAVKAASVLVLAVGFYLGITFLQVWRASTQDSHDAAEAIIVLGAAQYDGVPSPVLRGRLDHAIELYEAGVAPTLVVTGGKQPGDRFTEAAAGYRYLRDNGVPEFAILREEQGANTWDQLAAAARFLEPQDIDDVVLVSDDYHAYRLERIADELGLDAQISPVDPGLSTTGRARAMGRETVAVAVGRLIGFRRLVDLDDSLNSLGPIGSAAVALPLVVPLPGPVAIRSGVRSRRPIR